MRGLPIILLLFFNQVKKHIYTEAQMLDSIYYITLKLVKNRICGVEMSGFYLLLRNAMMDVIMQRYFIGG